MIAQAKGMGLTQNPKYVPLIKEADAVLEKMRQAMDKEMALVAAIRMKDVSALNAAIAKAQSDGSTPSSLASAIRMRDELAGQDSLLDELQVAVESKNILALEGLLQRASASNLTNRYVEDARILLEREGVKAQLLHQLMEAQDEQSLADALERSIQLGLSDDQVEAARARYQLVKDGSSRIEEIKSALRNLEVIRSSENGIRAEDINPLRLALENSGSVGDTALLKEAQDTLHRAEKQLGLQVEPRGKYLLLMI